MINEHCLIRLGVLKDHFDPKGNRLCNMFRLVIFFVTLHCAFSIFPHKWVDGEEDSAPYIVLGEDAEEGKYPYQVSLHISGEGWREHICGGSILTKNWIMTAAHCCDAGFKFDILVGTNSISKGGQIYKYYSHKIHPKYNAENHWVNDICLMKTASPMELSKTVQPVSLPPQGKELKDGDFLNVTGWGFLSSSTHIVPDKLQLGKNFVYIPNDKCGQLTNITTLDGHMCVNGNKEGQGICLGDSGGPIVKNGVQYGIASWIFMPCGNKLPDFYARVPNYINWIKEVLGSEAKDLKFSS